MKLLRTLLAVSLMSFAFAGLARAEDHKAEKEKACHCPKGAEGHHCDKCSEGGCKCGDKDEHKDHDKK